MRSEAKSAGFYRHELMGRDYDRIQIVTIREMLENGKKRLPLPLSVEVLKKSPVGLCEANNWISALHEPICVHCYAPVDLLSGERASISRCCHLASCKVLQPQISSKPGRSFNSLSMSFSRAGQIAIPLLLFTK